MLLDTISRKEEAGFPSSFLSDVLISEYAGLPAEGMAVDCDYTFVLWATGAWLNTMDLRRDVQAISVRLYDYCVAHQSDTGDKMPTRASADLLPSDGLPSYAHGPLKGSID